MRLRPLLKVEEPLVALNAVADNPPPKVEVPCPAPTVIAAAKVEVAVPVTASAPVVVAPPEIVSPPF